MPERRSRFGIAALLWLSTRQAIFVMLGAFAVGIVLGGVMQFSPQAYPFLLWPGATLAIGVLAGVTTLGEEQTRGIARFWAERRLPLGRMWVVKTVFHLGIAVVSAILMVLPMFVASTDGPFRSLLFGEPTGIHAELFRFTWLSLAYGFVTGHLAGMVFRKTVVAGLVAAVTGATLVGIIAPSVLCGGAAGWQVWGPAMVLLATARLLLYPWATERIAYKGPAIRVTLGSGLAASLIAGSVLYRILEIPNVSDRLAESGFEARLPAREGNDPVRSAVLQYRRSSDDAKSLYPSNMATRSAITPPPNPGIARGGSPPLPNEMDILERAARMDSAADGDRLKPWLDRVFKDNWPALLEELDHKPIGVFEDPRDIDYSTPEDDPHAFREMILALRARGIQKQAEGDPATYAHFIPGALAACRSARNLGGWRTPILALQSEEIILEGINDWLANLNGHTELLKPLLEVLTRHEREMPDGLDDAFWAERVILRNTLQRVGSWLPPLLDPKATKGTPPSPKADAEAEVIAIAWNVPWERVRRERILRVFSHAEMQVNTAWLSGIHLRNRWQTDRRNRLANLARRGLMLRRAARLQVAVRLYQIERPEPLRELAQLVPEYLPSLPDDPYIDRPFGYRLAIDEVIEVGTGGRSNQIGANEQAFIDIAAAMARPDAGIASLAILVRMTRVQTPTGIQLMAVSFGPMQGPPEGKTLNVVPGSSILWSVGPDKRDDGGHRTPRRGALPMAGQDLIFIVPPPQAGHAPRQP